MTSEQQRALRYDVFLSLQRALLGEVFPALRVISVEWAGSSMRFFCYVDGSPSEEDLESLSCVSTEVIADFPEDFKVDYEVIRLDAPQRIDDGREQVYARRENE